MAIRPLILLITLTLGACSTQRTSEVMHAAPAEEDSADSAFSSNHQPALIASAQPVSGIEFTRLDAQIPGDIWESLRAGFALPNEDNRRIEVQRNWYISHPDYMKRVVDRSARYLWHIQQELKKRNMPSEIALLPIVESAYDPFAYSHGRAAGLWQFIPSTGRVYGLEQDWWYDGRRDVVDSTNAALDYLQRLQRRFKGDWLLALAAYNSGEGTVSHAQKRNRKKGRPTDFWSLDLPKETRAYVPKLIALKQLAKNPQHYSLELKPLPDQARFEIIDTRGQIDLAVAAELAGIKLDTLYMYNPGYNQWATPPDGPHRLLIPAENAGQFRTALAQLPPEKRIKWLRHRIKSGETLSHIARHYHTTTAALNAANDLHGSSIRAGKHLMVPVASQGQENYRLSADQRRDRQQNRSRGGQKTRHRVTSGDTLWDLSRLYKVKVRSLASWNSMAPGDPLKVGQTLVVWTQQPSSTNSHPGARIRPVFYKVRKGDSLSRISSRFRVSVSDLRRWNGLATKGYLKPGQNLKLYVDVTRQADSS